ncbi:MAG: Mur ligase family protein [Bacteroidales bacterium]|nr:Mur ligase family protein [Bacteroidales bacterium]
MKRIHIISIGNYTMCHLAIALHKKEYIVSGSDVEIPEPQRTLLAQHNLLPEKLEWNADTIKKGIDTVISAPHIDKTNSELAKAYECGLLVMSFPEFIYHETKEKVRFVVSGSKGKSSILSMMIYALNKNKISFDYAALGEIKGVESSVNLKFNSRIALLEGDEFHTSAVETKPLHRFYHPQIVLLTNLIWEQCDEFTSFDDYLTSFKKLVEGIDRDGKYIYFEGDEPLQNLTSKLREDITSMPYKSHDIETMDGVAALKTRFGNFAVNIQDEYFLQNLNGARIACRQLGLQDKDFYAAISEYSFLN